MTDPLALRSRPWWTTPAALPPLVLLVAVVAGAGWLVYREYAALAASSATLADAAAPAAVVAPDAERSAPRRLATLADSQLFGAEAPPEVTTDEVAAADAAPESDALAEAPEELPTAALGIAVQGIVFDPGRTESRAILSGVEEQLRSYRVGDELPGDIVIRYIEARRVVIDHAGELAELPLVQPGAAAPPATGARPQQRVGARRAALRDLVARQARERD